MCISLIIVNIKVGVIHARIVICHQRRKMLENLHKTQEDEAGLLDNSAMATTSMGI